MIRVCHVIGKMDRAGAETLIMNLFRTIDRTKIQFDFLVHTNDEGAFDEEILRLGGRIFHIEKPGPMQLYSYYRACRKFFASHPEISIVHGHLGSTAAFYLAAAKKCGKYTIAHSHAQRGPLSVSELVFRTISHPTRYVADYYMGASLEALQDRYGKKVAGQVRTSDLASSKASILHNSIDVNAFTFSSSSRSKIRTALGIDPYAKVLLNVARLTELKNQKFLLEVFSCLLKKEPKAILLLAGTGELEKTLKNQAQHLGIDKHVMFLGVRDDIEKVLSTADIFIMTSFSEGLPVSVIEAQANGLPCLLSRGIPSLADCGEGVHFMDLSAGVKAWADKVSILLKDSCSDELIRQGGVIRVVERGFDISTTSQWLSDFYLSHCHRGM